MGQSAADSPDDPGQQEDPLKQGQERAREAVESGKGKMEKASGSLAKGKPGDAAEEQQGAVEDLQRARQEVEEQLEELRKDQQMEELVQLEQIFREMLEKQKGASLAVLNLDEKREQQNNAQLKRAQRIELRGVEVVERELSQQAEEAEGLLVGEGKSVVVYNVVEGMKHDLESLAIFSMTKTRMTLFSVHRRRWR